jgi:hypothetical protein
MVIGAELRYFGVTLENKSFWTRHFARSQETSSDGESESVGNTIKVEELR